MRVGRGGAIGAVFIVMAEVRCLKSSCGYEGEPDVTFEFEPGLAADNRPTNNTQLPFPVLRRP